MQMSFFCQHMKSDNVLKTLAPRKAQTCPQGIGKRLKPQSKKSICFWLFAQNSHLNQQKQCFHLGAAAAAACCCCCAAIGDIVTENTTNSLCYSQGLQPGGGGAAAAAAVATNTTTMLQLFLSLSVSLPKFPMLLT